MNFEETAVRLWKHLEREERVSAARHFLAEPPEELYATALGAVIRARHLRPQVARALPVEEQAKALGGVLDLGEPLAASLLVALHLGDRREILRAFLDAAGLAHEEGVLKDEGAMTPASAAALRTGVAALAGRFPADQVRTYLNTLWLQDPDRWQGLKDLPDPA